MKDPRVKRLGRRAARSAHAVQWDETDETFELLQSFTGSKVEWRDVPVDPALPAGPTRVLILSTEWGDVYVAPGEWIMNEDGTASFFRIESNDLAALFFERDPRAPVPDNDFVVISQDDASGVLDADGEPVPGGWRWIVYDGQNGKAIFGSTESYVDRSYVEACVQSYCPGLEVRVEEQIPGAPVEPVGGE